MAVAGRFRLALTPRAWPCTGHPDVMLGPGESGNREDGFRVDGRVEDRADASKPAGGRTYKEWDGDTRLATHER